VVGSGQRTCSTRQQQECDYQLPKTTKEYEDNKLIHIASVYYSKFHITDTVKKPSGIWWKIEKDEKLNTEDD